VALRELGESLRPFGLLPVRAGGSGGRSRRLRRPRPYSQAQPWRGAHSRGPQRGGHGHPDPSGGRNGRRVGHPLLGLGEVDLPLVSGEVHAIVASLASSMKLASPLNEIGAVVQDLPTGIVAELGRHAPWVTVEVMVTARGEKKTSFHTQVALASPAAPVACGHSDWQCAERG